MFLGFLAKFVKHGLSMHAYIFAIRTRWDNEQVETSGHIELKDV